ncbi:MAG: hypothetical protein HFI39_10035 [Lachnospiraceae bacterium]|nr:hypothetical protein [Lachnospiraceae bacterium]
MNEYQSTYEKEINLMELLVYCLKKWRWILIAMLAMGLLAGGYKYWSISRSNQAALTVQEGETEAKEEEAKETEEEAKERQKLIENYQLVIEKSRQKLQALEDTLNNCGLMQWDASHMQMGTITFYLNVGETEQHSNALDTLIAAYRYYVTDGRLAKKLLEFDETVTLTDMSYLIGFSDNRGAASGATVAQLETDWPTQNVMVVRVYAESEEICQKYMEAAQEAVLAYGRELRTTLENHELRLLATTQTERSNDSIRDYQAQTLADYTAAFKNLQALQAELSALEAAGEAVEEAEAEKEAAPAIVSPVSGAVKFAVIGLVLGVFLAGFAVILVYIMSGKLQSVESFEEEFGMKLLGRATDAGKAKKGPIDRLVYRLEEGPYADIPYEEQLKIVAANVKAASKGLQKIMLAGTMSEAALADVCAKLKEEISEVEFSEYKQLVFCAAALEELGEYDGVLFLEKKEVSATKLIHREKELAETRNVRVIGAVAV